MRQSFCLLESKFLLSIIHTWYYSFFPKPLRLPLSSSALLPQEGARLQAYRLEQLDSYPFALNTPGFPKTSLAGLQVLGHVLEGGVDGTLLLSWLPSQTLMALNSPWCYGATVRWENPLGTDSDF